MSSETIGAFTVGVARLAKHGDVVFEGSSPKELTDTYVVVMASPGVRASGSNVSGLPAIGQKHPNANRLAVRRVDFVQRAPNSRVWDVAVRYALAVVSSGTAAGTGEDDGVQVSWGVSETQADVTTDLSSSEPVVNSAGDPFDSVPQFTSVAPEIVFRYDSANFPAAAYSHNGCINASQYTVQNVVFDKHCAMLRVTVERRADAAKPYAVTVTLTGRRNMVYKPSASATSDQGDVEDFGWDVGLAQCGFQYLDERSGEKMKFVTFDADGTPREVSAPMALDANGRPADKPAVRRIQVYPDWDFSNLNLT